MHGAAALMLAYNDAAMFGKRLAGSGSMNLFRLGTALIFLGFVALWAAGKWWSSFYTQVAEVLGGPARPPLECLYSISGMCGTITHLAGMVGAKPYRAEVFWVGIAAIVIGAVMEFSARSNRGTNRAPRVTSHELRIPGPDPVSDQEWERFKVAASPKDRF